MRDGASDLCGGRGRFRDVREAEPNDRMIKLPAGFHSLTLAATNLCLSRLSASSVGATSCWLYVAIVSFGTSHSTRSRSQLHNPEIRSDPAHSLALAASSGMI